MATIINVTFENSNVIVQYETVTRKYPVDKIPRTVQSFLDDHKEPEAVIEIEPIKEPTEIIPVERPIKSEERTSENIPLNLNLFDIATFIFKISAPIICDASLTLVRFVKLAAPIILMTIASILDSMMFWIPEFIHRLGFILVWKVGFNIYMIWLSTRKAMRLTWRGIAYQWRWSEELKSEWRKEVAM